MHHVIIDLGGVRFLFNVSRRRLVDYSKIIELDETKIFVEGITTDPAILIAGGGHVGKAIAPLAKASGFNVWVVDDRKDFANSERFPEAEKIVNSDFDNAFDELRIRKNTFIIIATRGHNFDDIVLEKAVKTDAKYVALLGSKRKAILISFLKIAFFTLSNYDPTTTIFSVMLL